MDEVRIHHNINKYGDDIPISANLPIRDDKRSFTIQIYEKDRTEYSEESVLVRDYLNQSRTIRQKMIVYLYVYDSAQAMERFKDYDVTLCEDS